MINIYDLTFNQLDEYIISIGEKSFRTKQIWRWLYIALIADFSQMSDIKKELIVKLEQNFYLGTLSLVTRNDASDGTTKFLFELADENLIETVLMKQSYGFSICITTQVGCNIGCKFCASGIIKKKRDLMVSEIVEQIIKVAILEKIKISSVVVMGIGEPFDNYDNVIAALSIINNQLGLSIGARHITVSTSGIIPKIYEFAKLGIQYNLAISLHASNDETRTKLMPINKVFPLVKLVQAIKEYIELTNRRVTIEYILIEKINDTLDDAKNLVNLLKGLNVFVNLIPYNPVLEVEFKRSTLERRKSFFNYLSEHKIVCTLRREFGVDINAACGQLRSQTIKQKGKL